MIEYDEHGKEWYGYSMGAPDRAEPDEVIRTFTGNVQYLEWSSRNKAGLKKATLADRLRHFFSLLTPEAVQSITDDKESLIAEIVKTRNRYAHGNYEIKPPSIDRVRVLIVKVSSVITYAETVLEGYSLNYMVKAGIGNPYLRTMLGQSDRPDAAPTPSNLP